MAMTAYLRPWNLLLTTLTTTALLALPGCGQHLASGTLPATPASERSERVIGRTSLAHNVKVEFPTPAGAPDSGYSPSISLLTPSTFVEEHTWLGKLYYRFGTFANDSVTWGTSVPSGNGDYPRIATRGSTIVDVHYKSYTGLEYRVGTLGNSSIQWGTSTEYDDGEYPHVAFAGPTTLVEVHDGGNGKLWYHAGPLDAGKNKVAFDTSTFLDYGYDPSVASNGNGVVIAFHSGSSTYGVSHLYYQIGHADLKANTVTFGSSVPFLNTGSSTSDVSWSPQGYIVVTYECSAKYPFNIYYLCTTMGTLNSDNKTISWFGTSKSGLVDTSPASFSTALNGDSAVTMAGFYGVTPYMEYATSLVSDRANWEGNHLQTTLNGKSLSQIVFPGSHDAGMYEDVMGGVGAEALAQDENIYHQLTDGQRYFDLRPDYNFEMYHGPVDGGRLVDVLQDVNTFMQEGHREVVILKFSHFDFKSSQNDYAKLLSAIKNELGSYFYLNTTGKRLADIPINDLLKGGQGIVIPLMDVGDASTGVPGIYTYRDYEQTDNPQNGQFTAFDQWSNKEIFSKMKNDQLAKFAYFTGKMLNAPTTPCDFFLLSWTLTPISEVYSVAPIADAQLGPVMLTVNPNTFHKIPNILYVDFGEWAGAADVAVGMNARYKLVGKHR